MRVRDVYIDTRKVEIIGNGYNITAIRYGSYMKIYAEGYKWKDFFKKEGFKWDRNERSWIKTMTPKEFVQMTKKWFGKSIFYIWLDFFRDIFPEKYKNVIPKFKEKIQSIIK